MLENEFPLIEKVRKDPFRYNSVYIYLPEGDLRERDIIINQEDEVYDCKIGQLIELFTELNDQHVKVLALLLRKEPKCWWNYKKSLYGHVLASVPDCPFPFNDRTVEKLSYPFF